MFPLLKPIVIQILEKIASSSSNRSFQEDPIISPQIKPYIKFVLILVTVLIIFISSLFVRVILFSVFLFLLVYLKNVNRVLGNNPLKLVEFRKHKEEIIHTYGKYMSNILEQEIGNPVEYEFISDNDKDILKFPNNIIRIIFTTSDPTSVTAIFRGDFLKYQNFVVIKPKDTDIIYNVDRYNEWIKNNPDEIGSPTEKSAYIPIQDEEFDEKLMVITLPEPQNQAQLIKRYITPEIKHLFYDHKDFATRILSIKLYHYRAIMFIKIFSHTSMESFTNLSTFLTDYLSRIDPEIFDNSKRMQFESCMICYQSISDENEKTLSYVNCCGIYFHTIHIESWLDTSSECPNCRTILTSSELN